MDTENIKDRAAYEVFDEYFAHIDDPRQAHKVKHLLSEILFIAILAVIAGADDFNEIAGYARLKKDWLATFNGEIKAIPKLLDMFFIEGSVITLDAMGCQKKIASKITGKKADYILALKGNQGNLYNEVIDLFEKVNTPEFEKYIHQCDTQLEKDHGRIEQRECVTIENFDWLYEIHQWQGVKSIAKITATVDKRGQQTSEVRYYISSLPGNATFINRAVRKHWFIENKLHWILDVVFKEDYCRVRTGNGAENLNTIRKIAFNTIKRDKSVKTSFKNKRKMCGWNDHFALYILTNMKA